MLDDRVSRAKIKYTRPLPRTFKRHPRGKHFVAHEADIYPSPRARLAAKLVIFAHPHDLQKFWTEVLHRPDLGKDCTGAVNALGYERQLIAKDGTVRECLWICDPRYFCIVGLCIGHIDTEMVVHESIHAGFCYARRRGRDPWNDNRGLGEEDVAYPAARIAVALNDCLHRLGLY